jgi:hypothetical protein
MCIEEEAIKYASDLYLCLHCNLSLAHFPRSETSKVTLPVLQRGIYSDYP